MNNYENWKSCTCDVCKKMCRRPCWPTPEEAKKMLDAGLANRVMLDYWIGEESNVYIVCPAEKGYEGENAASWPGKKGCTFQNSEGLCEIHASGFKPLEARDAMHDNKERVDLHSVIAGEWDTDKGRAVVSEWRRITGVNTKDCRDGTRDAVEMLTDIVEELFGIRDYTNPNGLN